MWSEVDPRSCSQVSLEPRIDGRDCADHADDHADQKEDRSRMHGAIEYQAHDERYDEYCRQHESQSHQLHPGRTLAPCASIAGGRHPVKSLRKKGQFKADGHLARAQRVGRPSRRSRKTRPKGTGTRRREILKRSPRPAERTTIMSTMATATIRR